MTMSDMILPADYGAIELKQTYQKYLTRGLLFASVLHFLGVATYWASLWLAEEEEPMATVRIMKYSELGPPPSITNTSAAPAIAVSGPVVKPTVGTPVPVPDAEVSPEQTIATQTELSAVGPLDEPGEGAPGEVKIEDDGPPPDFVPFEKHPQIVKQVIPKYPEIAQRAGVQGTVWVKIWVDKEGKVRKAVILKSDAEALNEAAIEAAMQHVFTPAMQHNGPVAVWVSMPFKFRLTGN